MSKNARHEIVSNGYNNLPDNPNLPAFIVRHVVLDQSLTPRPVYKLYRAYLDRNSSTTQMAYKNDILIARRIELNQQTGACTSSVEFFKLDGPMSAAGGGQPTLVRKPLTGAELNSVKTEFENDADKADLREFLFYDVESVSYDVIAKTDGALPKNEYWDGDIGITEEKQAAHISDLLGGAPVDFIERMAWAAIHSRRNYIDPFDVIVGIPTKLDFTNKYTGTPHCLDISDALECWWVLFTEDGDTILISEAYPDTYKLYNPSIAKTAVRLFYKPFINEHNERYGLIVETYRACVSSEKEDPAPTCWDSPPVS